MRYSFFYLTGFGVFGGIEKFNKSFIMALSELHGEKVNFFSMYDKQPEEKYLGAFLSNWFTARGKRFYFIIKSLRFAFNSDVVILGHINLAILAILVKALFPTKRVILICHGIEIWQNISKVQLKAFKSIDRFITVSNYTRKQLIHIREIEAVKVSILHNTVDPFFKVPKFFNKPEYLLKRYNLFFSKCIVTVCRLSSKEAYKGYDLVLKALPDLLKVFPDLNYLIVGKYDEKEKNRLLKLAKDLNVFNNFKLLGFVPDNELIDHFLLGDVFVMPSRNEGFGIVFIEAMACGIPVIAGNADGSVDALANGALGILVDPGDVDAIGQAILNTLSKEWSLKDKQNLQKSVLQRFSFKAYKQRLEEILQRL